MAVLVRFLFYDTMSAQVFCANRKNMEKIFRVADQQFKCKHASYVNFFLQPHNKNAIKICRHMSIQRNVDKGPNLSHFIEKHVKETLKSFDNNHDFTKTKNDTISASISNIPYVSPEDLFGNGKKVFFQTYGCQMNVNDTEIAWSILKNSGYCRTSYVDEADVILVMTCAIREGAEDKVWRRLEMYKHLKRRRQKTRPNFPVTIGIMGCMAERLKHKILEQEKMVDIICGPDAYKDLPQLLASTFSSGHAAVNVQLSLDETYADVVPVRYNSSSPSAFVSIMRGCDNMCTYCIVPFTRGRERSRPILSILDEVKRLSDEGIKEVTLLGQNVNSYRDLSESLSYGGYDSDGPTVMSEGFSTVYNTKIGGRRFADLLEMASDVDPEIRIRFISPHPKDFPDEVLQLIREKANICQQIHLPAQSGSSSVLSRMGRGYTREAYVDLVHHIRDIIPDVALTSDFIAGFCGETEEDHRSSLSLIQHVQYNYVFCFPYSMRQKTRAFHRLDDDIQTDIKKRRANELVSAFRHEAEKLNKNQIGSIQHVLVEGDSKRSDKELVGRNDANTKVVFPKACLPSSSQGTEMRPVSPGDYVAVKILAGSSQAMRGVSLYHTTLPVSGSSVHHRIAETP